METQSEDPTVARDRTSIHNTDAKAQDVAEAMAPAQASDDSTPTTRSTMESVLLMLPLTLAIAVIMLDAYTINPAMPVIVVEFSANDASFAWIESAELLGWVVGVPVFGRSSDYFGKKLMLQSAVVVSFIGTAIGGFSNTTAMLLAGRAVQGLGCGGVAVMANICLASLFTGRERGVCISALGTTTGIFSAVGPSIGGAVTGGASWRWCFWLNLPLSAAAALSIHFLLDLPKPVLGTFMDSIRDIDWIGLFLIIAASLLLLVGLQFGGSQYPWNSAAVISMIVLGFCVFGVFIYVQAKVARRPLIPLHIFRDRSRAATTAVMFGQSLCSVSCKLFLTLYFQLSLGVTPLESAVYLLPFAIGTAIIFPLGGWLVKRTGKCRFMMFMGGPFLALGSGLMIASRPYTYWPLIIIPQVLMAIGQGFTFQSPTIAFQAQLRNRDIAAGQSGFSFLRTFAEMLSAVLGQVIFQARVLAQAPDLTSAGLDPKFVRELASGNSIAAIEHIRGLPLEQENSVNKITTDAFRGLWVFYTVIGVFTFLATFLVSDVDMDKQADDGLDDLSVVASGSPPAQNLGNVRQMESSGATSQNADNPA